MTTTERRGYVRGLRAAARTCRRKSLEWRRIGWDERLLTRPNSGMVDRCYARSNELGDVARSFDRRASALERGKR